MFCCTIHTYHHECLYVHHYNTVYVCSMYIVRTIPKKKNQILNTKGFDIWSRFYVILQLRIRKNNLSQKEEKKRNRKKSDVLFLMVFFNFFFLVHFLLVKFRRISQI